MASRVYSQPQTLFLPLPHGAVSIRMVFARRCAVVMDQTALVPMSRQGWCLEMERVWRWDLLWVSLLRLRLPELLGSYRGEEHSTCKI
jgi:hypothetical protein